VVGGPKKPSILSYTEQIRLLGKVPTNRVLSKQLVSADDISHPMRDVFVDSSSDTRMSPYIRVDRLRCADDLPVAQQIVYLRVSDFQQNLIETEDFTGSLFDLYNKSKLRILRAEEIIEARMPYDEEIELLSIASLPQNSQFVYVRNRVTFDDADKPIELLTSIERSDIIKSYRYQLKAVG
jgi:DNA-binding GntR family transcriptional regulator